MSPMLWPNAKKCAGKKNVGTSQCYNVGCLTPEAIDRAYPLISLVTTTLDEHSWRTFCHHIIGRRSRFPDQDEILIAADPLGRVRGLCVTSVRRHPLDGRILDVPAFITASAGDEYGVAAELFDFIKEIGGRHGCNGIRFWALGRDNWNQYIGSRMNDVDDHGLVFMS